MPRDVWRFFDTLNSLAGIIKDGESQKGNTLLHVAVKKRDDDMIRLLIRKGADVNAKNMKGNTALHYAAETGTAMILIKSGAHIDAKNKRGDTLLHKSAYNGMEDMVRVLLLNGADSNAVNDKGMTPLHLNTDAFAARFLKRSGGILTIRKSFITWGGYFRFTVKSRRLGRCSRDAQEMQEELY